jgi:hypothetical protein
VIGHKFEINYDDTLFIDPDSEILTFSAFYNDSEKLPNFINFQPDKNLIYGTPDFSQICSNRFEKCE